MTHELRYIVTYIPTGYSEPVEVSMPVVTGDPDRDVDAMIDSFDDGNGPERGEGGEIIHVRWSNGAGTVYAANGIDR